MHGIEGVTRARVRRRCGARACVRPCVRSSRSLRMTLVTQSAFVCFLAQSGRARPRRTHELVGRARLGVAHLTLAATEEMEEETEEEELEEEMASLLRLLRLDAAVPMLTCRGRQQRRGGSSQRPGRTGIRISKDEPAHRTGSQRGRTGAPNERTSVLQREEGGSAASASSGRTARRLVGGGA